MIMAYLVVQFFRGLFWCFAAMIWLCFAVAGWMLVLSVAAISLAFSRPAAARIIRLAASDLAPPAYLRSRRVRT